MTSTYKPNRPLAHVYQALAAIVFIAFCFSGTSRAAGDHDHSHDTPVAAGTTSPRVSSQSELFELVGVVDNSEMKIHLDRYASNEPVTSAKIEVEAGAARGTATPQPDGSYSFRHELLGRAGTLPVQFVVIAGAETDLLGGDLVIPDPHAGAYPAGATRPWRWAAYAGVALLLALMAGAAWRYRRRQGFASMLVAACALGLGATASLDAQASPGHDHGEQATPAAGGNTPRRLADGSVFLPKASQRQLGVRTIAVEEASLPSTVELTGRVVPDSRAGGKVQATQAGRIEAGPRGLPQLGQAVRKGEILAVVRASSSAIDRANQQAQSAELQASLSLARRRVDRLQQLEGTVPQKDIEAAQSDVVSLRQRAAAVAGSVSATEALVAPVSGVVAAASVVAGQVVNAGELLFEIVDPLRMSVEASAFDAGLAANIASASASPAPGTSVPLQFVGAGSSLREGAIPLLFRTVPGQTVVPLSIHQPVKVSVQSRSQVKGFALPTAAVVKDASNQDRVWVHTGAEFFEPRSVRQLPLDGSRAAVVHGLKTGDRVVTQGAALLNQVR